MKNLPLSKVAAPLAVVLLSLSAGLSPPWAHAQAPAAIRTPGVDRPASVPDKPPASPSLAAAAEPLRVLVIPGKETTLVAQMVGRITRMPLQMGGSFKQGQPLVHFDCAEQDARLKMSQAEYVAAKDSYDAKVRLKALDAAGDVEVQQAAAQAERARGQIELVRSQMKLCQIDAPFAGRLVKLHVREFQSTSVGQPVMDVVSAGGLKVRMNVPSKWLSWLKVGTAFQVTIDENGKRYPVRVSALNGRVDAVSQSIEIEGVILRQDASLLAGMSGSAQFAQAQ